MSKIEHIKPHIFLKIFCGATVIFLLLYFHDFIDTLLYNYLTVKVNWSNKPIDILLCAVTIFFCLYVRKKLVKSRYLFSESEFTLLIFFSAILLFLTLMPTSWHYSNMFYGRNLKLPHIILVFLPLFVLLIIGIFNKYAIPKKEASIPIFHEDTAVRTGDSDVLNRKHIAEKLKGLLIKQTFDCSFTIGIIGPWGNGKSSFINLLAEEFKEKDIIKVTFHPYLNHAEAEISSEFFHSFQYALRPYSGKVSNLILEYSHKLINFYSDKNLKNLLNKDLLITNSSAYDTYKSINEILTEINKKILVFVDDLDRLSQEEILQVLKLIRNTANFKNTIFIVAMDKGYVLSRLNNNDSILNNKFIDKFFQLEIHLPEIDNTILQTEFIKLIDNSSIDELIKTKIKEGLTFKKILFQDHINNLRDVKRVVNQIIFEYDFINEEVDINDFINFIFLKLTFPKFLDLLKRNPENYLIKSGNYLHLIKKDENKNPKDFLSGFPGQKEILNRTYKLSEELSEDRKCIQSQLHLTCEERDLLLKTLAYLFGDENKSKNTIRYVANFVRFMQLDYKPSYFLNKNFIELIASSNLIDLKNSIYNIIGSNQQLELFHRLNNFDPSTEEEFHNSIYIYTILFESLASNGIYESELLRSLAVLIEVQVYVSKKFDEGQTSIWIKENIFESSEFDIVSQLKLIGYLWSSKNDNKLWGLEVSYIEEFCVKKYEEYLDRYKDYMWDVNDFTAYQIFYKISPIGDIRNRLIKRFRDFLLNSDIKVFCAQSIDINNHYEGSFKLANSVVEFFESKVAFREFLESHSHATNPEIEEYLFFLTLSEIVAFAYEIVFNFKHLKLLYDRIEVYKQTTQTPQHQTKIYQVFYKVLTQEIYNILEIKSKEMSNEELKLTDLRTFFYKEHYYLFKASNDENVANKYLKLLRDKLSPEKKSSIALTDNTLLLDERPIITIFSSQPH